MGGGKEATKKMGAAKENNKPDEGTKKMSKEQKLAARERAKKAMAKK